MFRVLRTSAQERQEENWGGQGANALLNLKNGGDGG